MSGGDRRSQGVTSGPRVTPGTRREVGTLNESIARLAGLAVGTAPPNVFTTLGRHRGLFRRWLWFAAALMPGGKLRRADTELVILRVAHLCECAYEWEHHERIGRKVGLTAEQVEALRGDLDTHAWSARQVALLRAAGELHADRRIGDSTWAELRSHLDEVESIELCMLVGHYEMLAMTLNSLGVEPDRPRRG